MARWLTLAGATSAGGAVRRHPSSPLRPRSCAVCARVCCRHGDYLHRRCFVFIAIALSSSPSSPPSPHVTRPCTQPHMHALAHACLARASRRVLGRTNVQGMELACACADTQRWFAGNTSGARLRCLQCGRGCALRARHLLLVIALASHPRRSRTMTMPSQSTISVPVIDARSSAQPATAIRR